MNPLAFRGGEPADVLIRGAHAVDPREGLDRPLDVLVRSGEIAGLAEPGSAAAPEGTEVIEAAGRHLFPAFVDPHVHLRTPGQEHKEDLDRFREALAETEPVEEAEVPPKVRELFFGQKGNADFQIAYINPLPKMEMDDGRNAMKFAAEIGEIVTPAGTFHPSNDSIVFADVLKTMISDGKRVMVLAFVVVFLIVFADFRSFKATALVVSPIALGVLFMTVFMYVMKLKLNFYNIVVAATVVGTSIDNSVHIYHRYKEMGRGRLMDALRSSGGAALMSSLTNIFGFLGLVFASHNRLRSIGHLAVTGMMACLFTTLVYFPALLQYLEDKGRFRAPSQGSLR